MFPIHQVIFIFKKGGKSSFSLGWDKPEPVQQKNKNTKNTYEFNYDQPAVDYSNKKKESNYATKEDQYNKNLNYYNVKI